MIAVNKNFMILVKAKYVFLDPHDYIENGVVAVKGTKIYHVGSADEVNKLMDIEQTIDLGNTALLPGLINIHTHLELTSMYHCITPTRNFAHWVFQLVGSRMRWKEEDYITSIEKGAALCIEAGTTTVADITNSGHAFSILRTKPLRKIVYKEVIGLDPCRTGEIIKGISTEISMIPPDNLLQRGLSPHAPYSVSKELYLASTQLAREKNLFLCTHVAETEDEIEFLTKGTGNLQSLLRLLRTPTGNWKPPGTTPIQFLYETGILSSRPVLVHCNYITDNEISILRSSGISVGFCPRSHNFFKHGNHPIQKLLDAGVNVGLGTDSLASNETLSILDEMKFISHRYPIPPKSILSMATINGAKALGMGKIIGQIRKDFEADLCGIRLPTDNSADILCQILSPASENIFTMVAGVVCYNSISN